MEEAASLRLLSDARPVPWKELGTEEQLVAWLWRRWGAGRGPLTLAATAQWGAAGPWRRLRVLHCLPSFLTTILKLQHLRAMVGAEVVCCESRFVESDPAASRLLRERTGFRLVSMEEAVAEGLTRPFDVVLDTGGELAGRVRPLLGTVELTQTGEAAYRALAPPFPVISVDSSRLKRIEARLDRLGSADGFMRALRLLSDFDAAVGRRVLVFGYGKVGAGVCEQLSRRAAVVTVVETLLEAGERARSAGYATVEADDHAGVSKALAEAWGVATCTGREGALAAWSERDVAPACVLSNMGVLDEYGPGFSAGRVLCAKRALNFALEEPTLFEYLDPAFVASQEAIPHLAALGPGVHPLPPELDRRVIADWEAAHGKKLMVE